MNPSTELVYKIRDQVDDSLPGSDLPDDRKHVSRFNAMHDTLEFVASMAPRDVLTAQRMAKEALRAG